MEKLIIPKKQKSVLTIPRIIAIAVIIVAVALVIFLAQRQPKSYKVPIDPSQLMPFVSTKEARSTICNLKKEELFSQVCQSKYDTVSKEGGEKMIELFTLIEKVKNDKSISDYDRLLLAQAIFAALPTKDSLEANLYQPTLLFRLRAYFTRQNVVYAQEKVVSEEDFKAQMTRDLQNMVDSSSKGDNAWVINVMVSKYSWIDGKRQPLYSHQWAKVFDPFPDNPNINPRDITYHVQSVVGSKSSGQTVDVGGPSYKGTSEMIAYSFTIESWKSQEYTRKDGPVEEKLLITDRGFSEPFYQGEDYLNSLIYSVKLPSTKRSPKEDAKTGTTDCRKIFDLDLKKCSTDSNSCQNTCSEQTKKPDGTIYFNSGEIYTKCMKESQCHEKRSACGDRALEDLRACGKSSN